MEWEKVFPDYFSDKVLISVIHRNSYNSVTVRNKLIKKWAKDSNRHIFKEDTQMVSRYMKRHSASLVQEMQIRATVRLSLIY